ncbi:SLC13 family permease [Candidatus Thorarchaeota archaeon]|nr:MAG: SLC13 family permease [Candidatus Thorarchaeota archaeon]
MVSISTELAFVFLVLAVTIGMFIKGDWRYDITALFALLAVTITGILPFDQAFLGFGHPAVITVAAVLVMSQGLINSGFVDLIAKWTSRIGDGTVLQILTLTGLVVVLSAFMNNVGALALLMPVAIRMARRAKKSRSALLMPLAFGSMLGGMITLIGTPPNIVISTYRATDGSTPFLMFDFTPVGLGVALAGVLFLSLVGWRLIPLRETEADDSLFKVEEYIAEVFVPEDSRMAGKRIYHIESAADADVSVIALVRNNDRFNAPSRLRGLKAGDSLIVRGEPDDLKLLIDATGLQAVATKTGAESLLKSDELDVIEAVVAADSFLDGRTARGLNLRSRFGVILLAVSRQGRRLRARIGDIRLRIGDVLLIQGPKEELPEALSELGCLPLAERDIRLGKQPKVIPAVGSFATALALAALGILPAQVAFLLAAVAMVVMGVVSLDEAYKSINWPLIVLLGAMISVGRALEITGGVRLIADILLEAGGMLPPVFFIVVLMVVSMVLSSVIDDISATVLIAPIGVSIALGLGVSIDPFLMAVSIGASSSFLTPIGDHASTLVMGPGGYEFGDYARVGLPLQILVILLAVPLIAWFWPF